MAARKRAWFFLSVLFLYLSLNTRPCIGAGTLSVGESISGDQTIVSEGEGTFELGFFTPGNNSQNYYIGIWYRKISQFTVVWVANRDKPLSGKYSSQLKLLEEGNLVILDASKSVIWSTNLTFSSSNSTEVALLDSGNLVLRHVLNSSDFFWESFLYPTDTLLPGGKIWLNKLTNESHHLTAWKNSEDPYPGRFSNSLDPAGTSQLFLMWNGSVCYWKTGTWNGHYFSLLPEMKITIANRNVTYTYVSNQEENYFSYMEGAPVFTRIVINVQGQLNQLMWADDSGWNLFMTKPENKCEVYALCGAFGTCNPQASSPCECLQGFNPRYPTEYSNLSDWSGGCVRNTPLQCVNNASVNGEEVGFLLKSNMRLPINPQSLAVGSAHACELACLNNCSCNAFAYDGGCSLWEGDLLNLEQLSDGDTSAGNLYLKLAASELSNSTSGVGSAQACELACLNNCSCNAFAYDGGCSLWEGDLLNLEQLSDGDTSAGNLYLKLAASELSNSTSGGNKKGSTTGVIAGAVSGVVALLGLLVVLIWMRQRRKLVGTLKAVEGYLVSFSYIDLQIATKNFSEKLGGGGFGSVFKGKLPDSTVVAVKKLEGLRQGEKQFRTEVSTIGMIQHVNLVRLRGFCSEDTKRLLVYDFMPKGSLDSHLFHGKKDSLVLDWKTRYQIALGTARGLAYLHDKCRDCIIHCDIKPENILLDAEFCPKVADFGLAKLVGRDFSRVLTTIRGTIGYLAPEWISGVAITAKADVYSYGMMLFELVSGRRNSQQSDGEKVGFFPIWAASKVNEDGEILSLLDYKLEGKADLEELKRACKVACWCIQDEEVHRPSMGLVVQILEGIAEVNTPPIPRTLQALAENHGHLVFSV
ncbi:hypothetical protein NE237_031577 [Protea cynaroides]|uniref:Receptor-like serine/threonine-protein kinase n=1 Tax=Protea cynaroides TaxID=273540 RepID=A0A9Q0R288_9MAGN|nr:hypothetical protein NE237_031577 [Protea cynaroides]